MTELFEDRASLLRVATRVTDAQLAALPALRARYGTKGRDHCIEDTLFHLTYLGEAVEFGDATLFEDYIAWAKVMLASRGVGAHDLAGNLEQMRVALASENASGAVSIIEQTLTRLPMMAETAASFVAAVGPMEDSARAYLAFIRAGKRREADGVIQGLASSGASISDLYLKVFEPIQHEIGRLWQMNQITVAQEHFCTAAVQRSMSQLYSMLFTGAPGRRRVVAACAGGELHEIGLRMVTDLLESNGWDTVYLGANVPAAGIVQAVAEAPTALVALSTTITPNLRKLATLIEALRANAQTAKVPILVGGYPFRLSAGIVEQIGANGWAANAAEAVRRADELAMA